MPCGSRASCWLTFSRVPPTPLQHRSPPHVHTANQDTRSTAHETNPEAAPPQMPRQPDGRSTAPPRSLARGGGRPPLSVAPPPGPPLPWPACGGLSGGPRGSLRCRWFRRRTRGRRAARTHLPGARPEAAPSYEECAPRPRRSQQRNPALLQQLTEAPEPRARPRRPPPPRPSFPRPASPLPLRTKGPRARTAPPPDVTSGARVPDAARAWASVSSRERLGARRERRALEDMLGREGRDLREARAERAWRNGGSAGQREGNRCHLAGVVQGGAQRPHH